MSNPSTVRKESDTSWANFARVRRYLLQPVPATESADAWGLEQRKATTDTARSTDENEAGDPESLRRRWREIERREAELRRRERELRLREDLLAERELYLREGESLLLERSQEIVETQAEIAQRREDLGLPGGRRS